jgi:hypothetical protein
MGLVYIVEETNDAERIIYPAAYTSYDKALSVVKAKFRELLDEDAREPDLTMRLADPVNFNAPESADGTTQLYIENNKTHIYIRRLPIVAAGGKRKNKRASRKKQ